MLPRKELFHLPPDVIYLDGNSLGVLPTNVADRVQSVITDEWGERLIRGWNDAGWMAQPAKVGNMIGRLIGAPEGSVVIGDTLSIKVFQALAAGLALRPERRVILSDSGNFPSDLYMAEGLIATKGDDYQLRLAAPEDVADAIDDSVAVVMLTEVDYRTGRLHDIKQITQKAHAAGAIMVWDLAHSAGALPVQIEDSACEIAIGCTYKYLNAGPGAPAFIYVRPDLIEQVQPALSGWLGHNAPFAFEQTYRPAQDIERMRVGTPPVLQIAALEAALELWADVDMQDIRAASIRLTEQFIAEVEARCPDVTLASPRDAARRGSQVSFRHPNGYAIMQALISRGVIGDFRAPDIIRFGFTPMYLDAQDVSAAVDHLQSILDGRLWDTPEFLTPKRVT